MPADKVSKIKLKLEDEFDLLHGYIDSEGNKHTKTVIREMTGGDEEEIAQGGIRNNMGKVVTSLLANCVLEIGDYKKSEIKKKEKWLSIIRSLYLGDRDLIMLKIRELTYGNELEIKSTCPSCKYDLTVLFNMDEIEIEEPTTDPAVIEFELPRGYIDNKDKIHAAGKMRMPTGYEQELLDPIARKNPGRANTMLLSKAVYEIGDVNLNASLIRDLGQRDREYLINTLSEYTFGPKFSVNVICDSCGNDFDAGVNPVNFI